jgi:hypothetical protein
MKYALATALLLPGFLAPNATPACSMVGCLERGIEMRRDFVVRVSHDDKPLAGADVVVTVDSEKGDPQFSGMTGPKGTVRVVGLPPGDYWLKAELLGVLAGIQCFHVEQNATRKAKRIVAYEWGDLAPTARSISGKVVESLPSEGDNPIWNKFRRIDAPIPGATLTLQQPGNTRTDTTTSSQDGTFSFGQLPDGTYVLHIEGGALKGGPNRETSDWVIELRQSATKASITLRLGGPPGSCGGWVLN